MAPSTRAPRLGGLVAGTLGTTACFVLDAVLLLLAAALTAATTLPFTDPAAPVRERRPVHQDVGEAVGYARRDAQVLVGVEQLLEAPGGGPDLDALVLVEHPGEDGKHPAAGAELLA